MFIFGGANAAARFADVWCLDLSRPGAYVWRELVVAPGPTERAGAACVVVSSSAKLVVFGGFDGARSNECFELDLAAPRWRALPLQGRAPYLTDASAVALSGDRILLFGGAVGSAGLSDELYEIDLPRLTVRAVAARGPRPPPRMGHCAALFGSGSRMAVFGGRSETGANLNDLHVLQLDSLTWSRVRAAPGRRLRLPQPRAYAGAVVFKDFLYVLGGLDQVALESLWTINLVVQSDLSRRLSGGIRELKLAREKGLGRACFGCGNKFKMFKKRVQCSSCQHAFCGVCFTEGADHGAAADPAASSVVGPSDDESDDDDDAAAAAELLRDARDVCRDCRRQRADASNAAQQRYRFAPSAAQVERRKVLVALRTKPLEKFSVDDVGVWLGTIGLQRYAAKFRENAVDGAMLPELTVERLRQYCGVTDALHSRSFFGAVARLRRGERAVNEYVDVASWTPDQVSDWMAEIGMLALSPLFADSCVHGALLRSLTDDDLRALGVAKAPMRKKLLFCIARLLNPPPPSPLAALGLDQVGNWLTALGCGDYAPAFAANGIDGIGLLLINDELLAGDLGVQNEWHRRSILAGIAALTEKLERALNAAADGDGPGNVLYWSLLLATQWCDTASLPLEWRNAVRLQALHGAMLLALTRRHIVELVGAGAPASVVDAVAAALIELQQQHAKRFGTPKYLPAVASAWISPPAAGAAVAVVEQAKKEEPKKDETPPPTAVAVAAKKEELPPKEEPPKKAEPAPSTVLADAPTPSPAARRSGYQPLARMKDSNPTPSSPAQVLPAAPSSSPFVSESAYAETSHVVARPPPAAAVVTGVAKKLPPLPVRPTVGPAATPATTTSAAAASTTSTAAAAASTAASTPATLEERPSLAALQRVVTSTSAVTTVSGKEATPSGSAGAAVLSAADAGGKRRQLSGEELLTLYKSAIPARYHISFSELLKVPPQKIGEGAHGVVFKCQYRSVSVAVKQLKNVSIFSPELREFVAEAVLMAELKPHPNVVAFLGLCMEPLCLVVEYLGRGSLNLLLADAAFELPLARKLAIVRDIAAGMLHLSFEKVVHKDLAARNVLIGEHYEAKVSDFGMSRILADQGNEHYSARDVGPLKWMAPESLRQKVYSVKSDVWSFGVTVVEVLTRREPYPDLDIVRFATQFFIEKLTLMTYVPDDCPAALRQLLAECFEHEPDKRPTFQKICDVLKEVQL